MSDDLYEVIEPSEGRKQLTEEPRPKLSVSSDVPSEQENVLFLSISRGRRNHLKLHRFVDWDIDGDAVFDDHKKLEKDKSDNNYKKVSREEEEFPKKHPVSYKPTYFKEVRKNFLG